MDQFYIGDIPIGAGAAQQIQALQSINPTMADKLAYQSVMGAMQPDDPLQQILGAFMGGGQQQGMPQQQPSVQEDLVFSSPAEYAKYKAGRAAQGYTQSQWDAMQQPTGTEDLGVTPDQQGGLGKYLQAFLNKPTFDLTTSQESLLGSQAGINPDIIQAYKMSMNPTTFNPISDVQNLYGLATGGNVNEMRPTMLGQLAQRTASLFNR